MYRILHRVKKGEYIPQEMKGMLWWKRWEDVKMKGMEQPAYTTETGARMRFEIMKANQLIPKGLNRTKGKDLSKK